jgi:RimJ/RimL family protein N-acetyltransferase
MGADGLGNDPGRKILNRIDVPDDHRNALYAQWLSQRIPHFQTIGVRTLALWHGDKIATVVGFSNPHYNRVEVCWACDIPSAITRGVILTMLGHAFLPPMNRMALTATAEKANKRSRRFMEAIGFKEEGCIRRATPEGRNLIIYGLLRDDFLGLIQRYRGEETARDFARACGINEWRQERRKQYLRKSA